ncbi:methyltransferase domain-containing protein [Paenibacillus lycopersici]|uniref:Methyltransferase domain-containing protein n=1 Tax=Paenibacillus lycopersici TaxID=2704462 RepID=A0A6C0G2S6_9BACL|nr:class I SAM-dependent methyltransferase [Paenibacillus lycopersici]QHT62732.1 methyltransferase domain-containing protein [Paenibacillus lycopersici]
MGFLSVLGMAQRLVKERAAPGGAVIDATCGNGVDTQFLAGLVGPRGAVYAFDIQEAALERTRARLAALELGGAGWRRNASLTDGEAPGVGETRNAAEPGAAASEVGRAPQRGGREAANGGPLRLVHASHAEMDKHVSDAHRGMIDAVMFNLGYLPGANRDQAVITEPASTIAALKLAMTLLRPGGIVTAVLYPGHPGGLEEAEAVAAWASALPQVEGQAMLYRLVQKPEAPYLIAIEKKSAAAKPLI